MSTPPEAVLQTLLGRAECGELVTAYCDLIDGGQASAVADLFVDDGVFEAAQGAVLEGRSRIRAAMARREADRERRTRHVVTNVSFRSSDGDDAMAEGSCTMLVYLVGDSVQRDGLPVRAIVDARDEYRRDTDGTWRFRRRALALRAGRV